MTDKKQTEPIKLIAVGDTNVGKTSIINRFVSRKFDETSQPTLGAAFLTKEFKLSNGEMATLHIWDTAGQEKYRAIAPIYYRQAKIALCVYDICSKRSFEVMKNWVLELEASGPKDILMAVVGNKIDRMDDQEVDYAQVKQYATQKGAIFKLVSAKEDKNINDLFDTVALQASKKNGKGGKGTTSSSLHKDQKNQEGPKKKCC